jgi:hypothetical protein
MIRLFRLRARIRYWRRRALKAELSLNEAKEAFEAEVWRNRSREDTLITVPVRMAGMVAVGLEPRTAPAYNPRPTRLATAANPWDALTGSERMEWEFEYLPDALRNNVSESAARQRFLSDLAARKTLIDDPLQM